jgi:hypothetical protein
MTKGYTINYFIKLFTATRTSTLETRGLESVVSPRLGSDSVRFHVLNGWLDGRVTQVVNGTGKFASYGATPRARILKALKLRKQNRG